MRKKRADEYSRSKKCGANAGKRKYSKYRKRKNERRKSQRREERAREKKDRLQRIRNRSVLSETPAEVTNQAGATLRNYTVRKEVKIIQVTKHSHKAIRQADKEIYYRGRCVQD